MKNKKANYKKAFDNIMGNPLKELNKLTCPKHNRILIGKDRCIECEAEKRVVKILALITSLSKEE